MSVRPPEALKAFLRMAPEGSERALSALSAAVVLTDETALRLISDCSPAGIEPSEFLEAVQSCDFVVPRNSEWSMEPELRMWLSNALIQDQEFARTRHQMLLSIANHALTEEAGHTVPAYLLNTVGQAYHQALIDPDKALEGYRQAQNDPAPGIQWLAGILAEQQQKEGVLPASAIEPAFLRGMSLYREGSEFAAELYLRRVARSDMVSIDVATAMHMLGIILRKRNELGEAHEFLSRSLDLNRRIPSVWGWMNVLLSRGVLRRLMGDLEGALLDLDEAAALNRDLGDRLGLAMTLGSRGGVRRDKGDLDGAVADLDEAVALHRDLGDRHGLAMTLLTRGSVYQNLGGNFEHAISDWNAVLDLGSAMEIRIDIKEIRTRIQKVRKLQDQLKCSKDESDRNKILCNHLFQLGRAYLTSGDPVGAIHLFNRLLQLDKFEKFRSRGLFSLGKVYFKLSTTELAVKYFVQALDAGYDSSELRASLAKALTDLGAPLEQTQPHFDEAIKDSDNAWAYSWYGLALSAAHLHDRAEELARRALANEKNKEHPALLVNLARVLIATGDSEKRVEAIDILERASRLANTNFYWPKRMLEELQKSD